MSPLDVPAGLALIAGSIIVTLALAARAWLQATLDRQQEARNR